MIYHYSLIVIYYSVYYLIFLRFRQLQLSSESHISDFQSELQMKVFECERVHLLQEETNKSLAIALREKNKFREKIEVKSVVNH